MTPSDEQVNIEELAAAYKLQKQRADNEYKLLKELEFELWSAIRDPYPEEWKLWERGVQSVRVGDVSVEVKRTYSIEALQSRLSEAEFDEVVTEEVKQKVDGRKLSAWWKDAAKARVLEQTLVQQTPSIKIKE